MPVQTRRKTDIAPTEEPGLDLMPPGLKLMLLEACAPWEAMAMAAVSPWLSRMPSGMAMRYWSALAWARPTSPRSPCVAFCNGWATRPMDGNRVSTWAPRRRARRLP